MFFFCVRDSSYDQSPLAPDICLQLLGHVFILPGRFQQSVHKYHNQAEADEAKIVAKGIAHAYASAAVCTAATIGFADSPIKLLCLKRLI